MIDKLSGNNRINVTMHVGTGALRQANISNGTVTQRVKSDMIIEAANKLVENNMTIDTYPLEPDNPRNEVLVYELDAYVFTKRELIMLIEQAKEQARRMY